jgi:hypothetical protein
MYFTQCVEELQFTPLLIFAFQTQLFIITRSRTLKLTFLLPPSCCLSLCKYVTLIKIPHSPTIRYQSEFHYLQVNTAQTSHECVRQYLVLWKLVGRFKCIDARGRQTLVQEQLLLLYFVMLEYFLSSNISDRPLSIHSLCMSSRFSYEYLASWPIFMI